MKKSTQARVIAASCAFVFALFIAWIGGYDFDRRGPDAALVVISSVALAGFAASFPGFSDLDK